MFTFGSLVEDLNILQLGQCTYFGVDWSHFFSCYYFFVGLIHCNFLVAGTSHR